MERKKYKITKKLSKNASEPKHINKYTKYYPSILDPDFSHKIATHGLFKKYKSTINKKRLQNLYTAFETNKISMEDLKKKSSNIFIMKTITKMLRNFMSPYSPYRGLLIYHEMGVGKSCTGITIAESLKHIAKNSNTKIHVIRPMEFERQLFNINEVMDGKPLNQCTGNTYLKDNRLAPLLKECIRGKTDRDDKSQEACDSLKARVDKEIRGYYKFSGFKMWARDVLKPENL
jgi:hypothetical protein